MRRSQLAEEAVDEARKKRWPSRSRLEAVEPVVGQRLPRSDGPNEDVALGAGVEGLVDRVARTLALSESGHPPPKRLEPHERQNVFALPSGG